MRQMRCKVSIISIIGLLGVLIIVGTAGCIPAQELPPQLAFTPGAPLTIDTTHIQFAGVQVEYPRDWRVRTNPAETPESLLLIAPQGDALILLSRYPTEVPPPLAEIPSAAQVTLYETLELPSRDSSSLIMVYLWFVTTPDQETRYTPIFQRIRASIR